MMKSRDQSAIESSATPLAPPGPAWLAAEALGLDMSLVERRLEMSVAERFEHHERARQAVLALRCAGIEYYGFDPRHPEQA